MRHRVLVGAAVLVATAVIVVACSDLPTPPGHRTGLRSGSSIRDVTSSSTSTATGPQLLACTAPDSAREVEAIIGPSGGSLAIGATRIDIPPGAVATSTEFELALPQSQAVRVEIHAEATAASPSVSRRA